MCDLNKVKTRLPLFNCSVNAVLILAQRTAYFLSWMSNPVRTMFAKFDEHHQSAPFLKALTSHMYTYLCVPINPFAYSWNNQNEFQLPIMCYLRA